MTTPREVRRYADGRAVALHEGGRTVLLMAQDEELRAALFTALRAEFPPAMPDARVAAIVDRALGIVDARNRTRRKGTG
jgi:predicted protein tyrosine phosphatase